MNQLKKRSGYEETSVAFDILGQPKGSLPMVDKYGKTSKS